MAKLEEARIAKEQAEAIANHYGVSCTESEDGESWEVECSPAVEQAFCMSEEGFDEAVKEVTAATGVVINPEDIEF